mgnify:CR=1 FL=1
MFPPALPQAIQDHWCFPHVLRAPVFRPQTMDVSSQVPHGEEQLLAMAISILPQCPFAVSTAVKSCSAVK